MERMQLQLQLQGPIASSLWADKQQQQQQAVSTSTAAAAAQMPFLALLQGAGVVVEAEDQQQQQQHDGRKRHVFARAVSDLDLLESCVTQVVAPAAAASAPVASRTERRRKRPRPRARAAPPPEKRRKPEEAESQRMTHIAVERNRRRLMNDHLASLRSLIPSSYIPRGDQATVVGGAIDYVKQLEQQLVALQAAAAARRGGTGAAAAVATAASDGVFVSPQYASYSDSSRGGLGAGVDVEATAAVGRHVRVRVAGRRWPGRLVRAVAALEDLRLAVLHLAVTSVGHDAVVYCFNLKMEEGCEVATADEVATVVYQIFAYAAGACC
ncbi:transcription factor bHLH57-like isoform X2 [Miscanthus floridulus]|uniref:transcription factor bHLH57-like isoform X2 n=1 Tax=Miscanthus floridulus TaxID=154761 RepID=UPI003459474D